MTDDDKITRRLAALRLIPVVAIDEAEKAASLAAALVAGGLPCAEITFRTDAAVDAIARIALLGQVLVGAGTVLTVEQAERATSAGASFIVSPGLDAQVVEWCRERAVPVFPGVATPTELMRAVALGLDVVKLFPAEALGGMKTMQALAGPFPAVKFIPTGGIGEGNVAEWLASPRVLACGGSWMVEKSLIAAGNFDEIIRRVARAVELVR